MFDPYTSWLGIDDEQRPVSPYRLLGVDRWETDASVLENAALARLTRIRAYQVRYPDLATSLCNEIARALDTMLAAAQASVEPWPITVTERPARKSQSQIQMLVLCGDEAACRVWRIRLEPVQVGERQTRRLSRLLKTRGRHGRTRARVLRKRGPQVPHEELVDLVRLTLGRLPNRALAGALPDASCDSHAAVRCV